MTLTDRYPELVRFHGHECPGAGVGARIAEAAIARLGQHGPGNELFALTVFDERLEVTEELLRVAGGLAAFSGFYFAIAMLTDSTYRREFLEELTSEMRESFSERADYLALRAKAASADGSGTIAS